MLNAPLVLIEWEDSVRPDPEWQHCDGFECPSAVTVRSAGWLIDDGLTAKVLAPNLGDNAAKSNGQMCGVIVIPARSIVKVTMLKAVDDA